MLEWKRRKAVRRLAWVAAGFALFPGAFFMLLYAWSGNWMPEALLSFYPAALTLTVALVLHTRRQPDCQPPQTWRPERELITPLPRLAEPRRWTPLRTLPALLWLFPAFYLVVVLAGARDLDLGVVALLSLPPLATSAHALWHLGGSDRKLVERGVIARGLVRRIVSGQGQFRMKIEYEFDGRDFFHWTPNLSTRTWFGPLFVEERSFVTLLVDPSRPERFVVYPFCGHSARGQRRAAARPAAGA